MLIKYKTKPTIIVLSPNSANLIKILTQFVYSINIRYFSPPPLPCPVTLQGVTYKIGAEAKGKYISPSSPVWRRHIGEVARSDGGVKPDNQKILMLSFQPLFSGTSFLRSLPYTATRHRGEGWIVPAHHIKNARPWKKKNLPSSYILKKNRKVNS